MVMAFICVFLLVFVGLSKVCDVECYLCIFLF